MPKETETPADAIETQGRSDKPDKEGEMKV